MTPKVPPATKSRSRGTAGAARPAPAATTDADRAALAALAARYMKHLDAHVDGLVARLQDEIVEYRAIPASDIRRSAAEIVTAVLTRLVTFEVDPAAIATLEELARRRVTEGFPLEALTRSVQLAAQEVYSTIAVDARASRISASMLMSAHEYAWHFATDAAAAIAAINRDVAAELARRDKDQRAEFLRELLYQGIAPSRIQAEAPLYGLDPMRHYHPIRARPAGESHEESLALAIRRSGSTLNHRVVLASLEGELVGLAPQRPEVDGESLVAIGEPRDLASARQSFSATRIALDAAQAFGRTGVVALDDLGALPLALAADDLADLLEREHFGSFDEQTHADREIEATVRAWLELDQHPEEVAQALHVHSNTVRHRVRRFRELTGLDIRRTGDLVIAWWLLTRRATRRQGA